MCVWGGGRIQIQDNDSNDNRPMQLSYALRCHFGTKRFARFVSHVASTYDSLPDTDAAVPDALCLAVADAMDIKTYERQVKRDIKTYDQYIKDLRRHVIAMRATRMPQPGHTIRENLEFQNMYEDAVVALRSAKKCQKTRKEVHANLVDAMKKDAAEARRARARAKAAATRMLKRPAAGLIPIANS